MNKFEYTQELIKCWYESWDGQIAVSFSGGKDSTVLLDIVRKIYPEIKGVFCNTGLEYPEIVSLVKQTKNIDIIKPKIPFHKIIKKYGWPVISKKTARFVNDLQNASDRNKKTVNLRLTGITSTGKKAPSQKLAKKWHYLKDAPFKISNQCCNYLKKNPLEKWYKINNLLPIVGMMKSESNMRDKIITKYGCNMYDVKKPISNPLANWTDRDIWDYILENNLKYSSIYDKGELRTGCIFCMFGIMYDGPVNRFHRLKKLHPKLYNYCIYKLGSNEVLDFLGIDY